jgi:hypothetical protein
LAGRSGEARNRVIPMIAAIYAFTVRRR